MKAIFRQLSVGARLRAFGQGSFAVEMVRRAAWFLFFPGMMTTDEMERHWRTPEHISADHHCLYLLERIFFRLETQFRRQGRYEDQPLDDPLERRNPEDACKILWGLMEPMRRQAEEQGLDGFDAFLARHRHVGPLREFGPHPQQPNLTEAEAETWWESKAPRDRYCDFGNSWPHSDEISDNICMLLGFGTIGEQVAAVPVHAKWNEIPAKDRAIVLDRMRKGWVNMPETTRPC